MTAAQKKFIEHVRLVNHRRPKECGYDLRRVSDPADCAFREVFDVFVKGKSIGVVIKFPKRKGLRDNIRHSLYEVQAVQRMREDPELLALKRYAPKILFHETNTGVVIMPKYKTIEWSEVFEGFQKTFLKMVIDLIPEMKFGFDTGTRNFGKYRGHYVLLDAGLLGDVR